MKKKIIKYSKEKLDIDEIKLNQYKKIKKKIDVLMEEIAPLEEQIVNDLKEYMSANDKKKIDFKGIVATFTPAYVRSTFDSKSLKSQDIDTYNKYVKLQNINSSLSIKLSK